MKNQPTRSYKSSNRLNVDAEQNVNVSKESTYDAEIYIIDTEIKDHFNRVFNIHCNSGRIPDFQTTIQLGSDEFEFLYGEVSGKYAEQLSPLRERKEELETL
ncbi:hypothetical protein F8M41_010330 [Gigaspora margarita]|uniref:Uncharacterized protein n=1 Tax=Gigaspora margarita TaxID=4874 RepID=A0A8H4A1C6_GIGMA|nr:hypothetical protein F8M41_010330 [Gigaspora margarita]